MRVYEESRISSLYHAEIYTWGYEHTRRRRKKATLNCWLPVRMYADFLFLTQLEGNLNILANNRGPQKKRKMQTKTPKLKTMVVALAIPL